MDQKVRFQGLRSYKKRSLLFVNEHFYSKRNAEDRHYGQTLVISEEIIVRIPETVPEGRFGLPGRSRIFGTIVIAARKYGISSTIFISKIIMDYYIGIEIGGSKFQAVLGDVKNHIVERYRFTVDMKKGAKGIQEEIQLAISRFNKYNPLAVGIGFGGPVDFEKGIICKSHQIDGWNNFPLRTWIEKISGLPSKVDNDANVAGLAETFHGNGKNVKNVFYVCIGSGMGGGLIINNQIFHGEKPGEAEIGQMPADRNGKNMESLCCGWAADRKIKAYTKRNPASPLAKLTRGMNGGEAKFLINALDQGDKGAEKILTEMADNISYALSYAVHLFHPKRIIIGGGLSLTGDPLFSRINSILPGYTVKAFLPAPEVKMALLGEDVVCIGALILAQQALQEKKGKRK